MSIIQRSGSEIKQFFHVHEERRFFPILRLAFLSCLLVHFIYSFCFFALDAPQFGIYNVISTLAYAFCLFGMNKRHFTAVVLIGYGEVLIFSILSVILLGWDLHCQFFILSLLPSMFFLPFRNLKCSLLLSGICMVLFLSLYWYSSAIPPLIMLDSTAVAFNVLRSGNLITSLGVILVMSFAFGNNTRMYQRKLQEANVSLRKLASTDPLTGLLNRRSMISHLNETVYHSVKDGCCSVIAIGDIDDFKQVNDSYGHSFGDTVLVETSKRILEALPNDSLVCRWGGEEVLILMNNISLVKAKEYINCLNHAISSKPFYTEDDDIYITMTFGMCIIDITTNYHRAISIADSKLYHGKSHGKNCVIA